jgi:hypothetical protein
MQHPLEVMMMLGLQYRCVQFPERLLLSFEAGHQGLPN